MNRDHLSSFSAQGIMAVWALCAAWAVWACRSTALTPARWEPAFSSRYCRRPICSEYRERRSASESVAGLLEIGRKVGGRPILIPTTDDAAIWVGGARRGSAMRRIRFPRPGCRAGPPTLRQGPDAGTRPPKRRADGAVSGSALERRCGAVFSRRPSFRSWSRRPTRNACAGAPAEPNS